MSRKARRTAARRGAAACAAAVLAACLPALAATADEVGGGGSIAVPGGASLADARWAFEQHARGWMADLERNEDENRRNAPVYQVADQAVIRFNGYGEDYETEVKPTGSARAPYVGILRYHENVYTCLRDDAQRCTVTSTVPVSEIFSFRDGHWTY
jgi:hypothetical protein